MTFSGVAALTEHRAEGMLLHGLAEVDEPGRDRRFVFVNWDEEDDAPLELGRPRTRLPPLEVTTGI